MESSQAFPRVGIDTRPEVVGPISFSSPSAVATANPAFAEFAQSLATAPRAILQKFADVALGLCEAHAVGDARLLDNLSKFAAAAYEGVASRDRREAELGRRALDALAESTGHGHPQLLALFAHEVRSHLAPAKNACEVLQRGALDEATTKRMCAIIDRQIDAMARIVGELLDDARLRSGKVELHRREMALEEIIARSVELAAPLVAVRKQTLLVDVGTDGLRVEADELWLVHALQNVIGNAVKYADRGGRIEVRVTRDGQYAVISVCDTGVGLAPDQVETIFDLYAQAEPPPDRPVPEGLGIGLYFARLLIELHGGAIRATSEGIGRGSVFTIRVPCITPGDARISARN